MRKIIIEADGSFVEREMTPSELAEYEALQGERSVPLSPLSARQLRLGLLKIGIKPSQVDAAIAGLPEEQKEAAEIEWTYASQYQRDHYLIGLLAASFGLTEEAVDAAWRDAQAL